MKQAACDVIGLVTTYMVPKPKDEQSKHTTVELSSPTHLHYSVALSSKIRHHGPELNNPPNEMADQIQSEESIQFLFPHWLTDLPYASLRCANLHRLHNKTSCGIICIHNDCWSVTSLLIHARGGHSGRQGKLTMNGSERYGAQSLIAMAVAIAAAACNELRSCNHE
jgi:hypothetical protein